MTKGKKLLNDYGHQMHLADPSLKSYFPRSYTKSPCIHLNAPWNSEEGRRKGEEVHFDTAT